MAHLVWQFGIGYCQEAPVPLHMTLPTGLLECFNGMVAGFLQSERPKDQAEAAMTFMT